MKRQLKVAIVIAMTILSTGAYAQKEKGNIQSVFQKSSFSSGGYGAAYNKFTKIRNEFANINGLYGGWFVNHRLMLGLGMEAVTNNLKVPQEHSVDPTRNLSYQYGQFGLVVEYVPASEKAIHPVFHLFSGAGFSLQYQRHGWHGNSGNDNGAYNENWFFVAEPGVQLEINLFKWMRFSPGISYRASFGSDGRGLDDKDISGVSYSATLKFGKF